AAYKTEVGQAGSRSRVEVMAEARAHYDAKLLEIRKVYEERVGIARDLYARTVEEARQGYEAGVDEALASHRGAVHKVVHLVPEPSSNAQVDQDVSYAAATVSGNGLYGEASGDAPGVIWSSDADSQSPEAREGELSSDPVTSSSDPVTSSSDPVLPGSDPVLSGLNGSSW
ncbi:MAG: hypothetical protein ACRDZ5_11425, partial [Acidimicrobiales bacterium]